MKSGTNSTTKYLVFHEKWLESLSPLSGAFSETTVFVVVFFIGGKSNLNVDCGRGRVRE